MLQFQFAVMQHALVSSSRLKMVSFNTINYPPLFPIRALVPMSEQDHIIKLNQNQSRSIRWIHGVDVACTTTTWVRGTKWKPQSLFDQSFFRLGFAAAIRAEAETRPEATSARSNHLPKHAKCSNSAPFSLPPDLNLNPVYYEQSWPTAAI